jgi:hypothetical protein
MIEADHTFEAFIFTGMLDTAFSEMTHNAEKKNT